ncbi:MAG: hypothetical protein IKP14_01750 [Clostridiales bacterium]|nr:hypothetical protein [Clostridiales bacterium]
MPYEGQSAVCKMCGGSLQYKNTEKRWRCIYCGLYTEYFSSENTDVDGIARQVISDVANRRMSSAEENLSDCTRKNQKSVATVIANMSYNLGMFTLASSQQDRANYMDRLKSYVRMFLADYSRLGPEETSFYNSFGADSDDVWANLLSVYGLIGPAGNERIDFIMDKIDLSHVYAEEENKSLLRLFINKDDPDSIRKVLSNSAHIDHVESLGIVLFDMPDSSYKPEMIGLAMDHDTALKYESRGFDMYFDKVEDSFGTRMVTLTLLAEYSIPIDAMKVFVSMSEDASSNEEQIQLLETIYRFDSDTRKDIEIFQYLFQNPSKVSVIPSFFEILERKDIYLPINSKILISLLDNRDVTSAVKTKILSEVTNNPHLQMDSRGLDVVINHFLCNVRGDTETRLELAKALIVKNSPISSKTVTAYLVTNDFDGELKTDIMRVIIDTGFKAVFARNLLSDYMNKSRDPIDVKSKVSDFLRSNGYAMASGGLTDLILSDMPDDVKIQQVAGSVAGGSNVPPEALEAYLKKTLAEKQPVSAGLVSFLIKHPFSIKESTVREYLLTGKDTDKARHLAAFLETVQGSISAGSFKVRIGNTECVVNLLQAYIIYTQDPFELADQCAGLVASKGIQGSEKAKCGNAAVPFIKLVQNNEQQLSNTTKRLAEIHCKKGSVFGW